MHSVIHRSLQYWELECSTELLRVYFQTKKRVLLCTALGTCCHSRWLSRFKTGLDKCKDNKWETEDWQGCAPQCPWTAFKKLGKCKCKAFQKVIRLSYCL